MVKVNISNKPVVKINVLPYIPILYQKMSLLPSFLWGKQLYILNKLGESMFLISTKNVHILTFISNWLAKQCALCYYKGRQDPSEKNVYFTILMPIALSPKEASPESRACHTLWSRGRSNLLQGQYHLILASNGHNFCLSLHTQGILGEITDFYTFYIFLTSIIPRLKISCCYL